MEIEVRDIQPGWLVYAADGREVGKVVGVDARDLRIKHHELFGDKEWHVPCDSVTAVETGRVDISLTSNEVKQRN